MLLIVGFELVDAIDPIRKIMPMRQIRPSARKKPKADEKKSFINSFIMNDVELIYKA